MGVDWYRFSNIQTWISTVHQLMCMIMYGHILQTFLPPKHYFATSCLEKRQTCCCDFSCTCHSTTSIRNDMPLEPLVVETMLLVLMFTSILASVFQLFFARVFDNCGQLWKTIQHMGLPKREHPPNLALSHQNAHSLGWQVRVWSLIWAFADVVGSFQGQHLLRIPCGDRGIKH